MSKITLTKEDRNKIRMIISKVSTNSLTFNQWQDLCGMYFTLCDDMINGFDSFDFGYTLYHAKVNNYTQEQLNKYKQIKNEIYSNLSLLRQSNAKFI